MDSTVNSVRGWPYTIHKQISNGLVTHKKQIYQNIKYVNTAL